MTSLRWAVVDLTLMAIWPLTISTSLHLYTLSLSLSPLSSQIRKAITSGAVEPECVEYKVKGLPPACSG